MIRFFCIIAQNFTALRVPLALRRFMVFCSILELIVVVPFAIHGLELKVIFYLQQLDNLYFEWGTIFPSFSMSQMTYLLQFSINITSIALIIWILGRWINPNIYLLKMDMVGRLLLSIVLFLFYYFDPLRVISPFTLIAAWYLLIVFAFQYYKTHNFGRWYSNPPYRF